MPSTHVFYAGGSGYVATTIHMLCVCMGMSIRCVLTPLPLLLLSRSEFEETLSLKIYHWQTNNSAFFCFVSTDLLEQLFIRCLLIVKSYKVGFPNHKIYRLPHMCPVCLFWNSCSISGNIKSRCLPWIRKGVVLHLRPNTLSVVMCNALYLISHARFHWLVTISKHRITFFYESPITETP